MRRIPIRMKLAGALAVPLIGLFFITVVEVAETAADVDDVRAQTELARASVGPSGVITGIQNERTWAVVELIGQENAVQAPVVGYEESRRVTDEAITAFRETLESGPGAASDAYAEAMGNLDDLDELRETIDAVEGDRDLSKIEEADDVYQRYKALIQPFLDANSRVALAIDDAELRQATTLVDVTTRQLEVLSELARTSILEITVGGGLDNSSEIAEIARLRSTFDNNNRRLLEAPSPFDTVVRPEYPSGLVDGFSAELDKALTGDQPDMASMLATLNVPADAGFMGVRDALVDSLNDRAAELNDAAERRERTYIALAIVTLVVAVGLTWVGVAVDHAAAAGAHPPGQGHGRPSAARRGHRHPRHPARREHHGAPGGTGPHPHPRRGVRRGRGPQHGAGHRARPRGRAGRAAPQHRRQLRQPRPPQPEPPRPPARLHHRARGQRDQPRRALQPLPARPPRHPHAPQRRVAAGAGRHRTAPAVGCTGSPHRRHPRRPRRGRELPARHRPRRRTRHHHRLRRRRPRPPPRRAHRERARVLAPDQSVDIRGRLREDGAYTLAVIDTGLGMAPKDLTAANRRLAGAESFTVAPSKYLGHYVAGNLAARHGIEVRLDTSPGQGITATLTVPPACSRPSRSRAHRSRRRTASAPSPPRAPSPGPKPGRPPPRWPRPPRPPSRRRRGRCRRRRRGPRRWPPVPPGRPRRPAPTPTRGRPRLRSRPHRGPNPRIPTPSRRCPAGSVATCPQRHRGPCTRDASPAPEPLTGGLWPRAGGPRGARRATRPVPPAATPTSAAPPAG